MKREIKNQELNKCFKNNLGNMYHYFTNIPIIFQSINLFCNNIANITITQSSSAMSMLIYNISQSLLIYGNCIINENYEILNMNHVYYIDNKLYYHNLVYGPKYLHLQYASMIHNNWSVSPIETASNNLDIYIHMNHYLNNLMKQGGRHSGFLFANNAVSDDTKRKINHRISEFYNNITSSPGVLILDGQFEWQELMLTPDKLQIIEIKQQIDRQVCGLFGIPPSLVGIIDTTYNNYELSLKHFIEYTLKPLLKRILDQLNEFYFLNMNIEIMN